MRSACTQPIYFAEPHNSRRTARPYDLDADTPRQARAHSRSLHGRIARSLFPCSVSANPRDLRRNAPPERRRRGVASRRSPSPAPSACRSTPREPRAASIGDGTALNGATDAYVILHEVAHFALAPPERRELVEFGPGASPDTLDCSAAERTTVLSLERGADEAAASLLGIVWGWARAAGAHFVPRSELARRARPIGGRPFHCNGQDLLNVVCERLLLPQLPRAAEHRIVGRAGLRRLIGAEKVDLAMAEPQCVGLELGVHSRCGLHTRTVTKS
jgi:hypothetical protein